VPKGSTVLVLPFPTEVNLVPMRWQAAAHYRFKMPGGYFNGPDCLGRRCTAPPKFGPPATPTSSLLRAAQAGHAPAVTDQGRRDLDQDLRRWRAGYAVLVPAAASPGLVSAAVDPLGPPTARPGDVLFWDLGRSRR